MTIKRKLASAATTVVALLAVGTADAALLNGFTPPTWNTSVFVSVVERNNVNQVVRNFVLDTGLSTLDFFAGTPWKTNAGQATAVQNFMAAALPGSTVKFNVGGALNQTTFESTLYGFLTSGNATGPCDFCYSALDTGIGKINAFINSANTAGFNPSGFTPIATGPASPGWHNFSWGDQVGGAILPSNEINFNALSAIIGWRLNDLVNYDIGRNVLGSLTSNSATGDICFNQSCAAPVVPVPAAAWLLGSAIGLLGLLRRRIAA